MNENQIKGAAKVAGGKFEKVAGDALDNSEMRLGGRVREGVGHAQEAAGSAQAVLGQAVDHVVAAASTAGNAYGSISDAARDVARTLREKPRLSLLVAGATGLLLGLLVAGRGPKIVYDKPPS